MSSALRPGHGLVLIVITLLTVGVVMATAACPLGNLWARSVTLTPTEVTPARFDLPLPPMLGSVVHHEEG